MKIFFVGVHNKPGIPPLCSTTKTGKIIDTISKAFPGHEIIKTNLFDADTIPKERMKRRHARGTWICKHTPHFDNDSIVLLGCVVNSYFITGGLEKVIRVQHPAAFRSAVQLEKYIKDVIESINNNGLPF